jgi:PAS domain S-box-containing protein
MRSATEELETSKEELQSVNEELITVNHELKSSVEELSRTNADLTNLMASTDIGTIFLDRQLRIQRFTPSAQRIFNLIPADLDRPLSDITHKLAYPDLIFDAQKVLDDLATFEREVSVGPENWYLVRIAPYRTAEDRIAGVVATFIDISRRKLAEEGVRAGAIRYRTLFDLVPVAVYTTDAAGVIQEFNRRAEDLWGRAPEKNGEKFCGSFRIFHPDGRPMPHDQCPMARVLRGDELEPGDLELLVEQENGTRRNVAVAPRTLKDERGNIVGAINCMHDVTQRREAEAALRASEERFRNVADNVPQVIWTNEANGKANYFNRRWYEYSGLTYEESAGPGWQAIVHPEDEPAAVERWKQALEKGKVFDSSYRLRGADGGYRWFIGRNVPLRNNGQVLGWFGTATDIEDLKQAQARTQEIEKRFELLVEGTPDYAMFLLDPANKITYWSNGAEKVFGWSAKEAVGQTGALIFTPDDKAKGAVEMELLTALEEGHAPDRRWHMRKDGSRLWADGIMRRVDKSDGSIRGFAKIARDATEQRRIEDELRHARDQMEQRVIERTRDVLATNAELESAMAQRQQLEKELLEISEREKRRIGEDLHDMVCQELTATALFLKSSAKKVESESAAAAEMLNESALIVNRNVGVTRDLARGFQPVMITEGGLMTALRTLCSQVNARPDMSCDLKLPRPIRVNDETLALNLYRIAQEAVGNAVKHSGATEITLCMEREGNEVRLVVEDNGKGIRVPKRSKGLGLHIMKYRANVLGGTFVIEQGAEGGARIVCTVPAKLKPKTRSGSSSSARFKRR